MKKVLLIIFILSSFSSYSQGHYLGSKSGLLLSKSNFIENVTASSSYTLEYLPSFTTRITYDYVFASHFTLGIDAAYVQLGSINMAGSDLKIEEKADFISLPIKFGYKRGDRFFIFSNLGLATSVLLNHRFFSYYPNDFNGPIGGKDILSQYSRISVNAFVELGIGYRINDNIDLNLSGGYQHDIIPLHSMLSTNKLYYQAFSVNLGFRFRITNKSL